MMTTHNIQKISDILIVDDEAEIAITLAETLRLAGYEVDSAFSGEEALEKITRHDYQLIISDINMPHLPGTVLFNRLKEIRYQGRFVFITGYAVSGEFEKTVQEADGILFKPFPINMLIDYVQNLPVPEYE